MPLPDDKVHLDFETRSTVPFGRAQGARTAYQYFRDPTTSVLCACFAFGENLVQEWDAFDPTDEFPEDLAYAVKHGLIIAAHNIEFEWMAWNQILVPRYGAPPLSIDQMDCTAARAAIMALPRDLERACRAMDVPVEKDMEGSRLMQQMAKPRKPRKDEDPDGIYWFEDAARRKRLMSYCGTDVEAERALDRVLKPMRKINQRDWKLFHIANQRGVKVDVDLARRGQKLMGVVEQRYCDELQALTGEKVTSPTDLNGMKEWLEDQGAPVESLAKQPLADMLTQHDPDSSVHRVLSIRQEAGKSSVAKLRRFIELTHTDGRMRENFMFHGANTGRAAGKGAQLQNLPSRTGLKWQAAEKVVRLIKEFDDPEAAVDMIELLYGHVPEALSSSLRSHLVAAEGRKVFVADFSNIEGRVAAWLGGEAWKIQAFLDYDAGTGEDLYKITAALILGKTAAAVDSTERQIMGKVPELALGFGGGVGAFVSMGANFGVHMADYWEIIQAALDAEFIAKAHDNWERFGHKSGMYAGEWLPSESVKLGWRARHKGIVQCWRDAEDCAVLALQNPGQWFHFANGLCALGAREIGGVNFLISKLPSGRMTYKAHAQLKVVQKFGKERLQVHFWGVNDKKQWVPMSTYGGDLFQSFVQAAAYDLMMNGWENVERHGYEVVLSVHDELGAEGAPGRSVAEFERLMSDPPEWAAGCPVVAAGYAADRYRKD